MPESHGPDPLRGGTHCRGDASVFDYGTPDWCCCCDPCTHSLAFPLGADVCCRCIPQAVCFYFTMDGGQPPCCRNVGVFARLSHPEGSNSWIAEFPDFTITLSIEPIVIGQYGFEEGCQWRVVCDELAIDDVYPIDHLTTTCMGPPDISITGISIPSWIVDSVACTGTITISSFDMVKLPFSAPTLAEMAATRAALPDIDIPYSPCNCTTLTQKICVYGSRHDDSPIEQVIFTLVDPLPDDPDYIHWVYLPPGGDFEADREFLWLRSDDYGNCYLVFDRIRTSDPDNPDFPEIVDDWGEWIPINGCGCEMIGESTSTIVENGYIKIKAAPYNSCERWSYICGTCRCVPRELCVFGMLSGVLFNDVAVWDDDVEGWVGDGYVFTITQDDNGDCIIAVETGLTPELESETVIDCSANLDFEATAPYDPGQPNVYNWLWASTKLCDCVPTVCGLCTHERCGGPPQTLTVTIEHGIIATPEFPYAEAFTCTCSITVHLWYRTLGLECGYVGYSICTCDGVTTLIRAEIIGGPQVFVLQTTEWNWPPPLGTPEIRVFSTDPLQLPYSCDPYYYHRETNASGPGPYEILTIEE